MKNINLSKIFLSLSVLFLLFTGCKNDNLVTIENASGINSRPENLTCTVFQNASPNSQLQTERVFPNLNFYLPVTMAHPPEDTSHWYLIQQGGQVIRFANENNVSETEVILDLSESIIDQNTFWTLGLLGIAFHPSFSENNYVFLYYTSAFPGETYETCNDATPCPIVVNLSRFTYDEEANLIDPESEEIILTLDLPNLWHHAGTMYFGEDNYLYLALGDGGAPEESQSTESLNGSLLRIDIDTPDELLGLNYSIPPDNPFAEQETGGEVFAYGFRNPWRWSFDRENGQIWAADVGQDNWEEINLVNSGNNYGWPYLEGFSCFLGSCEFQESTLPITAYSHSEGCSVVGGFVYRGEQIPELQGTYLFADFCAGNIWGVSSNAAQDGSEQLKNLLGTTTLSPVSFIENHFGELLIIDYTGGIYSIEDFLISNEESSIPEGLSQSGCFSETSPSEPAQGLIPYDVNAPLWSDGANKRRWFAIPDGTFISIQEDGKFVFPIGSVLVKEFSIDNTLIETRLLMRHEEGDWVGYSYEWNDEQNNATLVDPNIGKTKTLASGQNWSFPSQSQCLRCHTQAANRVLGLEIPQLNKLFTYTQTDVTANQLTTLSSIGIFDQTLENVDQLDSFPNLNEDFPAQETLDQAARAYLHANCAMCHRPGGPGIGPEDFRYQTPLSQMGACNTAPTLDNLDLEAPLLLDPGNPQNSILYLRINSTENNRMPPLATNIIDPLGSQIISQWIDSLHSCE